MVSVESTYDIRKEIQNLGDLSGEIIHIEGKEYVLVLDNCVLDTFEERLDSYLRDEMHSFIVSLTKNKKSKEFILFLKEGSVALEKIEKNDEEKRLKASRSQDVSTSDTINIVASGFSSRFVDLDYSIQCMLVFIFETLFM